MNNRMTNSLVWTCILQCNHHILSSKYNVTNYWTENDHCNKLWQAHTWLTKLNHRTDRSEALSSSGVKETYGSSPTSNFIFIVQAMWSLQPQNTTQFWMFATDLVIGEPCKFITKFVISPRVATECQILPLSLLV